MGTGNIGSTKVKIKNVQKNMMMGLEHVYNKSVV